MKDKNGQYLNYINNNFIFAYKENAWELSCYGEVTEIKDYLVIGSGQEIAIGVLENNRAKTPKERIKETINTCANKTIYINNQIVLMETCPPKLQKSKSVH